MATDQWESRLVRQSDNHILARVLREVLIEMNVPKQGTAFADPELDAFYNAYSVEKANYWVVCLGNHIKGGAGIAPLHDGPSGYCELQKMYFLPDARGKGGESNDSKMPDKSQILWFYRLLCNHAQD